MKKPNFFIVGAPKCGTTSLASWLASHPQVCMSKAKEPHWFNYDHRYNNVPTLRSYESLFRGANGNHRAVGEASVWYLYSRVAASAILEYSPDARFIVMVRNPIDMAYSLHAQAVFSGAEDILDFETAWEAQFERERGRHIPTLCREPRLLLYGQACKLGKQVSRLLRTVGRDRALIITMDELRADAPAVYARTLRFLDLDSDERTEFPVFNAAKERRSLAFHRIVRYIGRAKRALRIHHGLGILQFADRVNRRPRPRPQLSASMRREMGRYFRADVEKLGALLGHDLSGWIEVDASDSARRRCDDTPTLHSN